MSRDQHRARSAEQDPPGRRAGHSAECLTASRAEAAAQAGNGVIVAALVVPVAVAAQLALVDLVASRAGIPRSRLLGLDPRLLDPGDWPDLLPAHPGVVAAVAAAAVVTALVVYRLPPRRCRRFDCPAGLAGAHRRRRDTPALAAAAWAPLPENPRWRDGLEYAHLGSYLYLRDAAATETGAMRPRSMWRWAHAPGPAEQRALATDLGLDPPTAAGGGR